MATSAVGQQLSRKFDRMGAELQRARQTAVRSAALALTTEVRQSIEKVAPGGRLRGVGKSGAKVGARFDMQGDARAEVKATGPIQLIERDTKAHSIKPKGRGKKKAISFNGIAVASAKHPGTKGRRPFAKGVEAGIPKAAKELRNATGNAVRRGLGA